ncbi:hypothetical protein ABL78_4537 [Leptomonas seymouri]|uniref:Surface antigen-like protein n=1 Tax=Leptomonas seymouri TaxID=5684 RepID=A0A0N0P5E9_LEPSE|nr:hypothetical protein ABL78_4537 [Leptomonas seymouri]|eukprot:KPI86386.1 hypothetical protein ABL78_4537 [Leptomonas seymouri]
MRRFAVVAVLAVVFMILIMGADQSFASLIPDELLTEKPDITPCKVKRCAVCYVGFPTLCERCMAPYNVSMMGSCTRHFNGAATPAPLVTAVFAMVVSVLAVVL